MADQSDQWGSRVGFVLAAVGSAIGLGNIWRFPFVAYEQGGGAFFIPYLFALLTAGIPLLVLEYSMGHRWRGSAPLVFRRIDRRVEWLGWWQVAVGFVIATYYTVVIGWALAYTWYSVGTQWGTDTGAFFQETFLEASEAGTVGAPVPQVIIPVVMVWAVVLAIGFAGVKRGIERAVKLMIPLLVMIFLALVVRALTLPGAAEGINALFAPDLSRIVDPQVWVAAYGQIFFTLSVGFAIMITYSSYLPRRTDLTGNAFIAGFANSSFELLAGIGIFASIGFLAQQTGAPIDEAVASGVGLAFIALPEIINQMPGFNSLFGVAFFGVLVLAGVSSMVSITEVFVAALRDKFSLSRRAALSLGGGTCAVVSLIYTTRGGLTILDVVDYFNNNFGLALTGLVEVVVMAWLLRKLATLQEHANRISQIPLGRWWIVSLTVVTPVLLGVQAILNVQENLTSNYSGYPTGFLRGAGWGVSFAVIVAAGLLSLRRWPIATVQLPSPQEPSGVDVDVREEEIR